MALLAFVPLAILAQRIGAILVIERASANAGVQPPEVAQHFLPPFLGSDARRQRSQRRAQPTTHLDPGSGSAFDVAISGFGMG